MKMNRRLISSLALLASVLSYAPAVSAQTKQPAPVRDSQGLPNITGKDGDDEQLQDEAG